METPTRPSGRKPQWRSAFLAAMLAIGFVAGCGTDPPDEDTRCSADGDCPDDKYCSDDNYCRSDCDPATVGACEPNEICTSRGECTVENCSEDADCPARAYCGGEVCRRECNPGDGSSCREERTCTDRGRCVPPGECATDSDCTEPPEPTCEGDNRVTFSADGICDVANEKAQCVYPREENAEACTYGCEEGECQPDPCRDVTCDSPPVAECSSDDSELITYRSPGTCQSNEGGECTYQEERMGCPDGCSDGECNASPCADVTCDDPPSDTCDGEVAVSYEQSGECRETGTGTTCDYNPSYAYCTYKQTTCTSATCKNPIGQTGGIVIAEYMADPAGRTDAAGEWFEVHNAGSSEVNLRDWIIRSLGNSDHTVGTDVKIPAGDRAVLARSLDPTDDGSVSVDHRFSNVRLGNDTDWLRLVNSGGDVVDHVYWESGTILEGDSRKLDSAATVSVEANDNPTNWCPSFASSEELPNGEDYGSPGAMNPACSSDPCADYTCEEPEGFCDQGDAVRPTMSSATCSEDELNNPDCDWGTRRFNCTSSEMCADGYCRPVPPPNAPGQGDIVITEVMGDPDAVSDSTGEWVELYNTTSSKVSLFSLVFEDSETGRVDDEYTIENWNAEIPAGGYALLARETDTAQNGGIQGAYNYNGGHLKNSPSGMTLRLVRQNGTVVDESYYGDPTTGESQQLSFDKYAQGASNPAGTNDTSTNWCAPTNTFSSGDKGTPGADNRTCP